MKTIQLQLSLGIRIPTSGRQGPARQDPPGKPNRISVAFKIPSWVEVDRKMLSGQSCEQACSDYCIVPETIKVSVEASDLKKLDIIRCKLSPVATQPDIIRTATEAFLDAGGHMLRELSAVRARTVSDVRKRYIRVPFDGELAERIGKGVRIDKKGKVTFEGTEACFHMRCATRQQVIETAIKWFIGRMGL